MYTASLVYIVSRYVTRICVFSQLISGYTLKFVISVYFPLSKLI